MHPSVAAWSAALLYLRLTAIHATCLPLHAKAPSGKPNTPCKEGSVILAAPAAYRTMPTLSPETS
eukprot:11180677-Lingulodinium_polyedra.AAC.1